MVSKFSFQNLYCAINEKNNWDFYVEWCYDLLRDTVDMINVLFLIWVQKQGIFWKTILNDFDLKKNETARFLLPEGHVCNKITLIQPSS